MLSNDYYIEVNEAGHDVIRQDDSDMAITIFELSKHRFNQRDDKLQFFGRVNDEVIAFQTGLPDFPFEIDLITAAITWYAQSIFCSNMPITEIDPRRAVN